MQYNNDHALLYPVRLKVVLKYFGELCLVLAALTIVPIISSLLFNEHTVALKYCGVFGVYLVIGLSCSRISPPKHTQANEGMAIVVLGFLFACFISAFAIVGPNFTFMDAIFEAVSSISTTGFSTLPSVAAATDAFLFQRVWMVWYGSLGFVTLSLVLLAKPGLTSKVLCGGNTEVKDLVGSAKSHARQVVTALCIISILGAIGAWLLGLDLIKAVEYSLASVATGGVGPSDSGIAELGWQLQVWICLLCLAGATPLTIYYRILNKSRYLQSDILQLKALILCCVTVAVGVTCSAYINAGMELKYLLHNVPLLAIQSQTTAGFTTLNISELDPASKLIIICSMMVGGSVGSTAGGIKLLRMLIIFSIIRSVFIKVSLSRHSVYTPKLAGMRLESDNVLSPLLLVVMLLVVILLSWLVFLCMGYNPLDSLFEVVAAITNSGISAGIVNVNLPAALKIVLCADMILGRLEVVALLIVLFPGTWLGKRRDG